ncbi:uncharacterized protein LOC132272672 [Cornus florida]|uniref:uncharacterized protein LOC132272672 n=1 Tax=Cornus florida TaxID=4283 RepID=UPI00289DD9A7|nr:uncharacterized protein LOC132272672 [Cornus florida]
MAPCLLIPFCKDKDEIDHELFAKAIGEENEGGGFPDYCLYSLAERKLVSLNNGRSNSNIVIPDHAVCIGSSHGWLAYIHCRSDDYVLGDDYDLYLTNPLITPVPTTIQIPSLKCIPKRVVMSSPPPSASGDDHCTVLMAIDFQHSLAYYKLGDSCWRGKLDYKKLVDVEDEAEDEENEAEDEEKEDPWKYDDIVYSPKDQLFYCIDYYKQIEAWDLRSKARARGPPCKLRIAFDDSSFQKPDFPEYELKPRSIIGKLYLVVDPFSADILSIHRCGEVIAKDGTILDDWENWKDEYYFKTHRFEVYRLNVANKSLEYIECLDDRVVFVGDNQSYMVSAQDFPPGVLMPNSIYFTPDSIFFEGTKEPLQNLKEADMGVYNLRDFTVTPIFPSHHPLNNILQPVMWFNPNRC